MTQQEKNRVWAEIDLSALAHNYHYLRSLAPKSKLIGLCKAEGYGHGGVTMAKALAELGAELLAVASVTEAVALREAGINSRILIFGDTTKDCFPLLLEHDFIQTVHGVSQAKALSQFCIGKGKTLVTHLKVDVGMGRLGFFAGDVSACVAEIAQTYALPNLIFEGIYCHFPCADDDNKSYKTTEQYNKFQSILDGLVKAGCHFSAVHCSNSAATLYHPETHRDYIRPGIALYGYDPKGIPNENLKPVLTLRCPVSVVRDLPKGTEIGYDGTHVLERDTRVAVLPVGYGDGYSRQFSNRMRVVIEGVSCPVLGRVCMDMTMVDVSHVTVGSYTEAVLYGEDDLLLEGAKLAGTIPYELLCNLSSRVPRIVVEN